MGLGVARMIIDSDYGSFPHSLLSTSKWCLDRKYGFMMEKNRKSYNDTMCR
jgi:hypothetical protein